jgi:two-component system sensor histidine kinase QseC
MKAATISSKLFFRIAPTILVAIAVMGGFAYRSASREINSDYDAQLITNANVLWILLQKEFREADKDTPKQIPNIDALVNSQLGLAEGVEDYVQGRMLRIWQADKIRMFTDTAMPETIPRRPAGFSEVMFKGEKWRIYSLAIPATSIQIEVGEKRSLRDALVRDILLDLVMPFFILVPLVGLVVWLGIGSGLRTIRRLVRQIRNRSPDDLSNIPVDHLPRDLFPLGQSINQLLGKLSQSLTAERRFADHAAHQLRTPLTALKLQLQMLAAADSATEQKALITDLTQSTDRATHLVQQLLRATRISHQPMNLKSVALYQATAAVVAEMANLAAEKQLDISLEGDERAYVRADHMLTTLLVGNLLENALKYTPASGRIRIQVLPHEGMWRLTISDTGPGIPESEREAVFHRFYRADNVTTDGAGLGLSIVGEVVERLSGKISLTTPETGQGLRVDVLLPRA